MGVEGQDQANQNKNSYGNILYCKLITSVIQKDLEQSHPAWVDNALPQMTWVIK